MCLLHRIFKERYQLSEDDVSLLFENMEQITFSKRDIIQKEGRLSFYLYFVERGIVRSFISRENKDVTIYIVAEGDTPLGSVGLTEILNSKFSIEAIEDVVLWRIHKKQLKSLCSNSVVFANFCRQLLETQMRKSKFIGLNITGWTRRNSISLC